MIISIINTTQLPRQDIQDVLRAVNRQLQEDFRRYWHTDVQLRLEGWTGYWPDPEQPLDMRGDAVLYLWDREDVIEALGYHSLTNAGVPYGFVFPWLSDELGEPWSVTLSHEALELAMDPEVNRLVAGPHPDPGQGGREVQHWYEICDPVQADTYTIDGIAVSNFVLPLYYTVNEEFLNHNDFLGRGLASFGTRPGGYIGFMDPATGRQGSWFPRNDRIAATRQAIKRIAQPAKRSGRHGGPQPPRLDDTQQAHCEAISFELTGADPEVAAVTARGLVAQHLGSHWRFGVCSGDPMEFDALYRGRSPLEVPEGWRLAHILAGQNGVAWAEPSLVHPVPGESDHADKPMRAAGLGNSRVKDCAAKDQRWALKQIKVPEAWVLVRAAGGEPGDGVLIGHPDSGYLQHSEMDAERIDLDHDRDFLDDDDDTLNTDRKHGRHGLGTASVIMSGEGGQIAGPASHARILPLRVTDSGFLRPTPVLFFGGMRRLRNAIDHAVDQGCTVISMSLGGVPHSGLHKAIRRAVDAGVIVLAAAGNRVRIVTWPARYDECIAVAGSDCNGGVWAGSSRGKQVDITAPGESVWRASINSEQIETVGPNDGTSYAVALTAGVAAMWRAHHASALAGIPPDRIQGLFREALKATAQIWKKRKRQKKFGPGIVDAEALLQFALAGPAPGNAAVAATGAPMPRMAAAPAAAAGLPAGLAAELCCAETLTALLGAGASPVEFARGTRKRGKKMAARRAMAVGGLPSGPDPDGLSPQLRQALGLPPRLAP